MNYYTVNNGIGNIVEGWKMNKLYSILVLIFGIALGSFASNMDTLSLQEYSATSNAISLSALEVPAENSQLDPVQLSDGPIELDSPSDWIKEREIEMRPDGVLIKINNPQWAILTNTNSMDPVFDETSHLIQVFPESPDEIKRGDIVSYQSPLGFMIVHRVIEINEDEQGWYAILRGDNNPTPDPWKVRFDMVRRVTVMVVY